jgi:hypothetical protein
MEYIGLIIVFISALVAIKGGTWNKNKKGLKKITLTGYLTMICAIIGLVASIILTNKASIERDDNKKHVLNINDNTDTTKKDIKETKKKLEIANSKIDSQSKIILENKRTIVQLQKQIASIDGTVLNESVYIRPGEVWSSSHKVFSGSIVTFYGFNKVLDFSYGDTRNTIDTRNGFAVQTPIIGIAGESYTIQLTNHSREDIYGKVKAICSQNTMSTEPD